MKEQKDPNPIFRLVHGTILEISKNRFRTRVLVRLLQDKGIIDSDELEKKWDLMLKKELPIIFEEIEEMAGYEKIKLSFEENGSILISGLSEDQ